MEDGSEQQSAAAQLNAADMNGFVIPNGHTWFRQNAFLCTPDNGLLYHSKYDVNYISPLVVDQMPRVQIMNVRGMVKSLACSQDWSDRREFATFDDQNNLLVWDLDVGRPVKGHKGHVYKAHGRDQRYSDEVNSAICFTRTQKVLSVEQTLLIVYCLMTDTYKMYADIFRSTVVLLSPCPDDRNVFAAGMRNGLILLFSITDMSVLCNMRGHDREVVSIDWMQVRVLPEESNSSWRREERPKKEARKKKAEKEAPAAAAAVDNSDIFDIYDYNENQEEFGTIVDKQTSTFDKKDRFFDKVHATEGFNFLEECQNLKQDIIKAKEEQDLDDDTEEGETQAAANTDDENELDEAEKLRDYIIVDGDGKEKIKSGSDEEKEAEPEDEGVMRTVMVSGSRENIVYFWDYQSGLQIDRIILPNTGANKRLTTGIFVTPAFVNPWKVVANTNAGHVFEWTISFRFRGNRVRMQLKQNPVRYPIDMAVCLQRARAPIATFDPKCDYVWCQSMNRKILGLCVTGQPSIVVDLTCLTTGHERVVESPLESTVLAIGCTDKKLVTVNLATLAYNEVNCVPYMNKIGSAVSALDWHPDKQDLIAFGTVEGRIGLLDTGSSNNVPILLNPFQTTKVYSLKWCQMMDEHNTKITVLFATGQSKSAYYKVTGTGKYDPNEIRQFGMLSCVSASDEHFFVGTNNGVVIVTDLSKDLKKLYQRNIASRYISSLQFKDDVLAVASSDNHIRLIDFTKGIDDKVEDNVRLLEGHTSGVCNIRWGHGDSKLLVSASFDNSVRVWDTTTTNCLAVYHSVDSVFCAIFSPIHENIVIFVGKGTTLAFVDYTKHPPQLEEVNGKKAKPAVKWAVPEERLDKKAAREKKRAGKPLSDLEKSIGAMQISDKAGSESPLQTNGHVDPQSNLSLTDVSKNQLKPALTSKQVDQLADRMEEVKFHEIEPPVKELKANIATLFHLSNREINRPADVLACIKKLAHYEEPNEDYPEEGEEAPLKPADEQPKTNDRRYHLEKLFMAEKDLRELIEEETTYHHASNTSSIGTILLPQVGFRLKEQIIERIASKTMTDQLLALTPSISFEFWRKCCEAYAYQLLEKKYPLAAVPYFLASHKIAEAIENLCQHKYYREAWVICKLRKTSDDPVREKVSTEWAQYLESNGNLEGAALVWTAAKQYKNAVAVLSKRREITEDIRRAIDTLNDKMQKLAIAQ